MDIERAILQETLIAAIGTFILAYREQRCLIAIDGFYGAGKSTFARHISQYLREFETTSLLISTDDFMRYSRKERNISQERYINHFGWYDIARVSKFVTQALDTSVQALEENNLYNHITGERNRSETFDLLHCRAIVVEGMYALHHRLFKWIDLGVMLQASDDVLIERVIKRDSEERGIEELTTRNRFSVINGPFYYRHFLKRAKFADLLLDNSEGHILHVKSSSQRGDSVIGSLLG